MTRRLGEHTTSTESVALSVVYYVKLYLWYREIFSPFLSYNPPFPQPCSLDFVNNGCGIDSFQHWTFRNSIISSEEVTVSMIRSHASRVSTKKIQRGKEKPCSSIDIHETWEIFNTLYHIKTPKPNRINFTPALHTFFSHTFRGLS